MQFLKEGLVYNMQGCLNLTLKRTLEKHNSETITTNWGLFKFDLTRTYLIEHRLLVTLGSETPLVIRGKAWIPSSQKAQTIFTQRQRLYRPPEFCLWTSWKFTDTG